MTSPRRKISETQRLEDEGREIWTIKAQGSAVRELVDKQAEDEGLWFQAETAPEAYLQQELRKLHALIEKEHE